MKKNPIRFFVPAILGFLPYLVGLGFGSTIVFWNGNYGLVYIVMALSFLIHYFLWWLFGRLSFQLTQSTPLSMILLNLPSFLCVCLIVVASFSSTPVVTEIVARLLPAYFIICGIMILAMNPIFSMLLGLAVMTLLTYAGCQYQKHKSN